jgi:hypothetical protein
MDESDMTVTYDHDDGGWVARRAGETLGTNHIIGPGEAFAAVQWAAWLTGEPVPWNPALRAAVDQMPDLPTTMGPDLKTMMERHHQNAPGHRTDEFSMRELNIGQAQACTSLADEAALERARSVPSGTSGGWVRSEHPAVTCDYRPATHRHLKFVAAVDWAAVVE